MSETPDEGAEGAQAPLDFDPYRFGKPDHPIPPEFAPPGYVAPPVTEPPPVTGPPPVGPVYGNPQYAPPPAYGPPPSYGPPAGPAYGAPVYPPAGPGGYPPVPPQFHADYPQPHTGNGRAIAAMVLGILSIPLALTSLFDLIPIVLALVFGFTTRAHLKRDPRPGGGGMALAGIICAAVGAVLTVVATVVYVHVSHSCAGIDTNSSEYSTCVRDHL